MLRRLDGTLILPLLLTIAGRHALPQRDNISRPYRNLYGQTDFATSPVENLLQSGIGGIEFLRQNILWSRNNTIDVTPDEDSVYDFIVVGAGTAGATLAARVSEIRDARVLLIEAGPDESMLMDIPLLVGILQSVSDINWQYRTEPSDKYCVGMRDHRCNWPRGKVMGGSSVLNYMIATRGSPEDYDQWAEMGNDGWSYKDVLKYFKKLENVRIPEYRSDTEYRGTKGPVSVSHAPYHTPIAEAFLNAGQEQGYPLTDYNRKESIGFAYIQSTTHKGFRVSSNKAYLYGRQRSNLDVTKNSMVHRILFDRINKRATGIRFAKNGRFINVFAKKEVLLCAGAVGSPQLLMLSGIGPAKHLRSLGIQVIKDAPVGDNVMDHIAYAGLTFTVNQPVTIREVDVTDPTQPYLKDFLLRQSGPITVPGGCETIAFLNVDDPKKRKGVPNIELLQLAGPIYEKSVSNALGINERIQNMFAEFENQHAFGVFPLLLKPKSRGWVRLRSKDVMIKPKIVPNYLDDPEDIRVLIAGIRVTIELSRTKAMRKFGTMFHNKTLPGCEGYRYDSDEYWLCHIRTETMNIYHYSGSCKMGARNDKTAVVDPRLKVIGVKGLRVVDSSIMPEIIAGHTNIPTYMIAEKAADMIKEDWGYTIE